MTDYSFFTNLSKTGISLRKLVIQTFTDTKNKPNPDLLASIFPYDQARIKNLSAKGAGIYWCINPQEVIDQRSIDNTSQWAAVGLDLDIAKENDGQDEVTIISKKSELHEVLNTLKYPPTGILETKNGLQPYWFFDKALELNPCERKQANANYKSLVKGLCEVLKYKSEGDSIARVLRLEGTLHQKNPSKPFKIISVGGTGKTVSRDLFLEEYMSAVKIEESGKKYKKLTSSAFGQSIYDSDVIEGLKKLSGHSLVKHETFDFEEENNGKRQIIINGSRTGQWISLKDNAIGGHPGGKGSYNLVGWVQWYHPEMSEDEIRKQLDIVVLAKKPKLASLFKGYQLGVTTQGYVTISHDNLKYEVKETKEKHELNLYRSDELVHRDTVNLSSDPSRQRFIKRCTEQTDLNESVLSKDLMLIPDCMNEINRQIMTSEPEENDEEKFTEGEISKSETLLLSPTLLFDILGMIRKLGVAGEEVTALLHYLTLTSRITEDPLSVVVKAESATGKSYVLTKVIRLFPKDAYIDITDATAQSFFYADPNRFAHKIIIIFELHGSEKTDYSIRTLQSEKKLKIQVTVKDPDTGEFMAKEREVSGPTGFITTTTNAQIHSENETRHLSLFPDESVDQTKRTFEVSDAKYRVVPAISTEELRLWQITQTLLKPYRVLIPYVEELRKKFPKEPVRVRRDYNKLLSIIEVITLLHQKQREVTRVDNDEYLIATLVDFHIAKVLLEKTLQKTIYSISPKTERLIEVAKEIMKQGEKSEGVSIKEMAEVVGWDSDTTRKWLEPGVQKGFFKQVRESKGSRAALYLPTTKDMPSENILPFIGDLYEVNPEWLGSQPIYDPVSGQILQLEPDN